MANDRVCQCQLGDAVAKKNILNKGDGDSSSVLEASPFYEKIKGTGGILEVVDVVTLDSFVAKNSVPSGWIFSRSMPKAMKRTS